MPAPPFSRRRYLHMFTAGVGFMHGRGHVVSFVFFLHVENTLGPADEAECVNDSNRKGGKGHRKLMAPAAVSYTEQVQTLWTGLFV